LGALSNALLNDQLAKAGASPAPPEEELTSRGKYQLALKHHVLQLLEGSPPLSEPDWCLVLMEPTPAAAISRSVGPLYNFMS
jgi:hypothetical protein